MIAALTASLAVGLFTTTLPGALVTTTAPPVEPAAEMHAVASRAAALDTTFSTPADARIEIENHAGSVVVRTWDRAAVRVVASRSAPDRVRIRSAGAVVQIESPVIRGPSQIVDLEITIPASAPIRVSGPFNDVEIDGAGADVAVETVKGDLRVRGGKGRISLRSVEGEITLEGASGQITLSGVNDGIRASDLDGEITVETVNGDITLESVRSASVSASTINGELSYEGTIRDQGRYAFTTHNGDLVLVIPEGANAVISIATFNGEVESAFPVALTEIRRGRRFQLNIGNGSARIELESFNGTINLKRRGGART